MSMPVSSLLDTDLYKLTMMQIVYHRFPETRVRYQFYCRSPEVSFRKAFPVLEKAVNELASVKIDEQDLSYLKTLPWLRDDFLTWFKSFRLRPELVSLALKGEHLELSVSGTWLDTILFEIPLLAIISEALVADLPDYRKKLEARLNHKIKVLNGYPGGFSFSDFGTRRRASFEWQEKVLETLMKRLPGVLAGTSNVLLASRLGIPVVGTMAHEYLQACQVLSGNLAGSQKFALKLWWEEYGHDLSVALTDVIGLDVFLSEMPPELARRYRGVRHDSGDPFKFGEKMLSFYQRSGIDPMEKTLVFSDGLDFSKAKRLWEHFHKKSGIAFGIGTFLTHDPGYKPANIVIKMTHCNDQPVVKISDTPGKVICEDSLFLNEALAFKEQFAGD